MKKKLKLDALKLKSFVTISREEKNSLKGGAETKIACVDPNTWYSCLDYVSCNQVQCARDRAEEITTNIIVGP